MQANVELYGISPEIKLYNVTRTSFCPKPTFENTHRADSDVYERDHLTC